MVNGDSNLVQVALDTLLTMPGNMPVNVSRHLSITLPHEPPLGLYFEANSNLPATSLGALL